MNVVAFVFARGGSKGVPRKNLRLLAGKPLLAHAVAAAQQSRWINRVIVSTDDSEIAAVARRCGAEVPFMRPSELATDSAPESLAWQHALSTLLGLGLAVDVFVCVPATSPLRTADDLDRCIEAFLRDRPDIVIAVSEARRNPYFNMVVIDKDRTARLAIRGDGAIARRQDAPRVYDISTVAYVANPAWVLKAQPLFASNVKAVVVPEENAIDIDTELDLEIAEFLMARRLNGQRRNQEAA